MAKRRGQLGAARHPLMASPVVRVDDGLGHGGGGRGGLGGGGGGGGGRSDFSPPCLLIPVTSIQHSNILQYNI